jgi:hypothetical protein
VTGDRIEIEFCADDAVLGSTLRGCSACDLSFQVRGWDVIKQVEVVRNNVPILVRTPDYGVRERGDEHPYRLRIEWGWGPMKGYQVFDWEGCVEVRDGRLEQVIPCFCSDPFDEQRRKRIITKDGERCCWQSYTSRGSVFTTRNGTKSCSANDALCLEVRGRRSTQIVLELHCQTRRSLLATGTDWSLANSMDTQRRTFTVGELLEGRRGFSMGRMPTSVVMHRAMPQAWYTISDGYAEHLTEPAYYYLRVTQENGQMAWTSPIWFDL